MIIVAALAFAGLSVAIYVQQSAMDKLIKSNEQLRELIHDITLSQANIITHIAREDRQALKLAKHFPNYNPN